MNAAERPRAGWGALRRRDRLLLALVLPIWVVCLGLHFFTAVSGRMVMTAVSFEPAPATDAYPRIEGVVPGAEEVVREAGLAVGDEIVRVGDVDVGGAGRFRVAALVQAGRGPEMTTPVTYRREGSVVSASVPALRVPVPWWWPSCFALSFAVVAVVLLLRAPTVRVARATGYAFLAFSFSWLVFLGTSETEALANAAVYAVAMFFAGPLLLRAVLLLPEEAATYPRWAYQLPWAFAVMAPVATSAFGGGPFPAWVGLRLHPVLMAAAYAAMLAILARNYRVAGPVGRRQVKWVLFGFYVGLAPALLVTALIAVQPVSFVGYTTSLLAMPFIPVAFLVAILRYNLFDIDRLISAAASYTALSVLLLTSLLVVTSRAAEAAAAVTRIDATVARWGLSFGLVALAIPLYRRLAPRVDRLFFPERYAIEQGAHRLLVELPLCNTPAELLEHTGAHLAAMSSDNCAVYSRLDVAFGAVYVRGQGIPPAIEADGPLERALLAAGKAVEIRAWMAGMRAQDLAAAERAVIGALGDGVLLPVRGSGRLAALAFLGAKRSGDVYTANELTLLTAVGAQLSNELLRFESRELLEQARTMQQRLRRYVPGAITRQIEAGHELDEGERDVTILFVDVRGYTRISEGLQPTEIFSTVNRYTETVSNSVQAHGGTIVEFNGDGMMTVFGAPLDIQNKEAAAIATALDIVAAVRGIGVGGVDAATPQDAITVGVGIATGPAYIGNVHSVDRLIWTAIGNTTNLAARLQSLSRDLDASIVIDAPTHARGADGTAFVARGPTAIRGRSEPIEIFTLSL
jgi:class 3 adenylate cyclase